MADDTDTLVRRRSRRSTAGNRMEAALAEFAAEDLSLDQEEDKDFVVTKDEEDAFESDFASTDEEAAQEDGSVGDKVVEDDERQARRAAKARAEKAFQGAQARARVTFNPEAQAASSSGQSLPESASAQTKPNKPRRRVSLGFATDAETGEIVAAGAKRRSSRSHTVLNRSETARSIKEAEEKRAALPKKSKVIVRAPTQDELIARALDMEEGNLVEHRNYLVLEEERRKRARVIRPSVAGPLIRWVSKVEEKQVRVQIQVPHPTYVSPPYAYPSHVQSPPCTNYAMSYYSSPSPAPSQQSLIPVPAPPPNTAPFYSVYQPPPPPPQMQTVTQRVKTTRNYVVHELGQTDAVDKPSWKETMIALFGDHVEWEELKVYVGKGRPLSRPVSTCAITGLPARYLDPRTGVPYANVRAYEVLTGILRHEWVWSEGLGCYVEKEVNVGER